MGFDMTLKHYCEKPMKNQQNKFCQVTENGHLCSAESLVVTLLRRATVIARHIFVGHFLCPRCPHTNIAALWICLPNSFAKQLFFKLQISLLKEGRLIGVPLLIIIDTLFPCRLICHSRLPVIHFWLMRIIWVLLVNNNVFGHRSNAELLFSIMFCLEWYIRFTV